MNTYDKVTPDGTRDLLFEECSVRNKICDRIRNLFELRSFDEVVTPSVEFYDVFDHNIRYFPQESMLKLIDSRGRLMVMRPDCTIPIARLAATRLKGCRLPIRLFYKQNIFRITPDLSGKSNEILQMGVELIGTDSAKSDLEIIELAAGCLEQCTFETYRIEICHIGFFKAIMESIDADSETKETIRKLIEQKNYAALNGILDSFSSSEAVNALKNLPRLFGGEEVFEKARALFSDAKAISTLDYLKTLYLSLSQLGLKDKIIVDLGLVNQAEYYTGTIFRGYLEGAGEPVISGGRYDNLTLDFGEKLPATGFGVNIDLLSKNCIDNDPTIKKAIPEILVHSNEENYVKALKYINSLVCEGRRCENSVFTSQEEAIEHAKKIGIKELHIVAGTVKIVKL